MRWSYVTNYGNGCDNSSLRSATPLRHDPCHDKEFTGDWHVRSPAMRHRESCLSQAAIPDRLR